MAVFAVPMILSLAVQQVEVVATPDKRHDQTIAPAPVAPPRKSISNGACVFVAIGATQAVTDLAMYLTPAPPAAFDADAAAAAPGLLVTDHSAGPVVTRDLELVAALP